MSQFMLLKPVHATGIIEEKCVRVQNLKYGKDFLTKMTKKIFENTEISNIWTIENVDSIFTQAQHDMNFERQSFETTELYSILSELFDNSEILVLWYSDFYQDLDEINIKDDFLNTVKKGVQDSMCECYIYVDRNSKA